MKTLILYKSKYGDIKRYAEWLGEAATADVKMFEQVDPDDLKMYDTVIFGTYCTGSRFPVSNFLMRNWSRLRLKNVIVFAASNLPLPPEKIDHIYRETFPERITEKVRFYSFPGEKCYEALDWKDKARYRFIKLQHAVLGRKTSEAAGQKDNISRDVLKPLLSGLSNSGGSDLTIH